MSDAPPVTDWPLLAKQVDALFDGEADSVANAANLAALLWQEVAELNWAGVYFLRGDTLVVGPFQGKPACVRIPLGQGVCGTAAAKRQSVIVDDVHQFEGHIPCDGASNSEIVVPILLDDAVLGVLDLDSPRAARFSDDDRRGLETIAARYAAACA